MYNKLSVYLSYILRHAPESIGLSIEYGGWCVVNELIYKINQGKYKIDHSILKEIVANDSKNRYSYNIDYSKIRANQGHSIDVLMDFEEVKPPAILYHGTGENEFVSISVSGIKKGSRQYVHLSSDYDTAEQVSMRRKDPIIINIDTENMYKDGHKFYLSENNVWLITVPGTIR